MNRKRFKADTSHNRELLHEWEGMGETERAGYQSNSSQGYRAEHRVNDKATNHATYKKQCGRSKDHQPTSRMNDSPVRKSGKAQV